ncbi:hypothetical protein HPP92_016533 [Vanilla planifolia]|uniref:Pentatricopeptide repeat-containing protein n=1 Tax=Vanilla planifolia TaxID=51239 RepID=A0A835QJH6_VANPL|nr:hypothetical protein HPP92_016533 [Vanilla planifolia]
MHSAAAHRSLMEPIIGHLLHDISFLPSIHVISFLPIPLLFSRVSLGFKLHCLSSSINIPTFDPKNHACSDLSSILRILELRKAEDLPDETIDSLLTGLSPKDQTVILNRQRDWQRSLRLFRRIKSAKDYSPNEIHYNVILRTLGRARRWDELRLCWIEMEKDGLLPSNNTYAILMDVYRRAGLFKEALLWLKHMKSRRVFPDEVSINTAVQVLKDSSNLIWIGSKHFLLTELFKSGGRAPISQITSVYDVGPQTPRLAATYNTLIDLYGKAGKLKDASDAFSQMLRSGVMPDMLTFNTIINICCSHGRLVEAESLLLKMEERRVQPDTTTFNIFMTYYASLDDADNVLSYYSKIREYGLQPDAATFRIILPSLCKKSMILEVEAAIAEILEFDSQIDEQSMLHVMMMYINKGLRDKASGFFF